ncbi:MAG: DUF3592 domain-containing protein [Granulosicoccus sp.]
MHSRKRLIGVQIVAEHSFIAICRIHPGELCGSIQFSIGFYLFAAQWAGPVVVHSEPAACIIRLIHELSYAADAVADHQCLSIMRPGVKRYLGIGLVVLALLPLSHGSALLSQQQSFNRESLSARATVVDHRRDPVQKTVSPTNAVYAIVEFTDDQGNRRRSQSNVSSYPPQHDIGDDINVRYHTNRTDDVREVSFTGMWLESTFYLLPGLLTMAGGLLLIFRQKRA